MVSEQPPATFITAKPAPAAAMFSPQRLNPSLAGLSSKVKPLAYSLFPQSQGWKPFSAEFNFTLPVNNYTVNSSLTKTFPIKIVAVVSVSSLNPDSCIGLPKKLVSSIDHFLYNLAAISQSGAGAKAFHRLLHEPWVSLSHK